MSDPIVVGLLGITHPHASARVRALREIDDVEVVAAADDDSRLKYFTDKYDLEPRTIDEILDDERINAIMVHSKSRDMVPHTVRALAAGKSVVVEKPGGGTVDDLIQLGDAEAAHPDLVVQVGYNVRLAESVSRAKELIESGLLHHHRLASGECPHGVGHHVATLGVDHDRVDPLVIENFIDGALFEVVLVREVLQARIVVGGRNHLDVVNFSERSHPRRCVRMGDPEEADHDGFGHHRLLTFLVLRGLHRLENRGADCRWWSPGS